MSRLSPRLQAALWWLLPLATLVAMIGWETDWGRAVVRPPQPAETIEPKPVAASLLPEFTIAGGVATRTETVCLRRPDGSDLELHWSADEGDAIASRVAGFTGLPYLGRRGA